MLLFSALMKYVPRCALELGCCGDLCQAENDLDCPGDIWARGKESKQKGSSTCKLMMMGNFV